MYDIEGIQKDPDFQRLDKDVQTRFIQQAIDENAQKVGSIQTPRIPQGLLSVYPQMNIDEQPGPQVSIQPSTQGMVQPSLVPSGPMLLNGQQQDMSQLGRGFQPTGPKTPGQRMTVPGPMETFLNGFNKSYVDAQTFGAYNLATKAVNNSIPKKLEDLWTPRMGPLAGKVEPTDVEKAGSIVGTIIGSVSALGLASDALRAVKLTPALSQAILTKFRYNVGLGKLISTSAEMGTVFASDSLVRTGLDQISNGKINVKDLVLNPAMSGLQGATFGAISRIPSRILQAGAASAVGFASDFAVNKDPQKAGVNAIITGLFQFVSTPNLELRMKQQAYTESVDALGDIFFKTGKVADKPEGVRMARTVINRGLSSVGIKDINKTTPDQFYKFMSEINRGSDEYMRGGKIYEDSAKTESEKLPPQIAGPKEQEAKVLPTPKEAAKLQKAEPITEPVSSKEFMQTQAKVMTELVKSGKASKDDIVNLAQDKIKDGQNVHDIVVKGIMDNAPIKQIAGKVGELMDTVKEEKGAIVKPQSYESYKQIIPNDNTSSKTISDLFANQGMRTEFTPIVKTKIQVIDNPGAVRGNARALGMYNDNNDTIYIKTGLSKTDFNKALNHEMIHALDSKGKRFLPEKQLEERANNNTIEHISNPVQTARRERRQPTTILGHVLNYGGFSKSGLESLGLWKGLEPEEKRRVMRAISQNGQAPDSLVTELSRNGIVPPGYKAEQLVNDIIKGKKAVTGNEAPVEEEDESQYMESMPADELKTGDTLYKQGEKFTVKGKTDKTVTLKDGKTVRVPVNSDLVIDRGSLNPETKKPPFELDQEANRPREKDTTTGTQLELGAKNGVENFGRGEKGEQELPNLTAKAKESTPPVPTSSIPMKEQAKPLNTRQIAKEGPFTGIQEMNTGISAKNITELPDIKDAVQLIKDAGQEIKEVVSPASMPSKPSKGKEIFRENLAKLARSNDVTEKAYEKMERAFDKLPDEKNYDIYDLGERGQFEEMEKKYGQDITSAIRDLQTKLTDFYGEVKEGDMSSAIENYMAHYYKEGPTIKKKKNAAANIASHRPFPTKKTWEKERKFPTLKEAREAGYIPLTSNPIIMNELKLMEMRKWKMAHDTLETLKSEGLVKWSPDGKNIPDGWTKINVNEKMRSFETKEGETVTQRLFPYADPHISRIFNNYLSPGLGKFKLFQILRQSGNFLNQAQLGLSAFHLGFTSIDAMVSKLAISLQYLFSGHPLKAMREAFKIPIAAVTNVIQGDKLYKAWYGKSSDPMYSEIATMMQAGGGRANMDRFYSNRIAARLSDYFKQGKIIQGLLQIPYKLIEVSSKPIMEYLVPRQKMGVFADMMKYVMETKPNLTHAQMRQEAQKAWDSVDNRMGQLVYDNIFWNKTLKELLMANVRSVGWNIGTIREIGGGIGDLFQTLFKKGFAKNEKMTYRLAYIIALPVLAGLMGAVYQYLRTGEAPKDLKDLYFPRTGRVDRNGNPDRDSLPTYMKDLYHYTQDPLQTIANKVNPVDSLIIQMLNNKDFYGVEIRHQDDPIVKQLHQILAFGVKQIIPFGIRNTARTSSKNLAGRILPFIGIVPAPFDINKTQAEKVVDRINQQRMPSGTKTSEEYARQTMKKKLRSEFLNREPAIMDKIRTAVKNGDISENDSKTITEPARKNNIAIRVRSFDLPEVLDVWKKATPEERKLLRPVMAQKYKTYMTNPAQTYQNHRGMRIRMVEAMK